jgi:hypothetical protein
MGMECAKGMIAICADENRTIPAQDAHNISLNIIDDFVQEYLDCSEAVAVLSAVRIVARCAQTLGPRGCILHIVVRADNGQENMAHMCLHSKT